MDCQCSQDAAGYALHVEEIRAYANLVAGVLGHDLAALEGEERIRACHCLLSEHPYAYPFALELSLQLPAPMAITWLRGLCASFYAKEDVRDEIDAFLIWRMSPAQAFSTVLRHAERMGWFLPGTMRYLEARHPLLAAYVKKRRNWDMSAVRSWSARLDSLFQLLLRPLRALCVPPSGTTLLRDRLIVFYLRKDCPQKPGNIFIRLAVWALMRIFACRVTASSNSVFRREWMNLPFLDEPRTGEIAKEEGQLGVDVVTVIWGEEYVRRFDEYNAPSLLASGNLPMLSRSSRPRLVFYTTRQDMKRLKSLPVYDRLRSHAPVRFIFIEKILKDTASDLLGLGFTDKYLAMTASHNHCFRQAALEDRYVFCNFPDMIWQCDFFTQIMAFQLQGKKQIFAYSGPYAVMEEVQHGIQQYMHDGTLALDNSTLRSLTNEYRHPFALLFYKNAALRYFGAIMCLFRAGETSFVAHMACHTPVLLKPGTGTAIRGTIDYDYPLDPQMNADEIYIIDGDARIAVISLDPEYGQNNALRWPPYNAVSFVRDFRAGMRLWNRIFFALPCRFHGIDTENREAWLEAEAMGRAQVANILRQGEETSPVPPVYLFLQGALVFLREQN